MRRVDRNENWGRCELHQSRSFSHALLCALLILSTPIGLAAEPGASAVPRRTIIISLPDRKLALTEDGRVTRLFDIAVGAPHTPSPTGDLSVINKIVRPTYYHRGITIRPGKRNPLGSRWIGLSRASYGIHGTNEPHSIGQAASHGCFRMKNDDVEELFSLILVGDKVEIHGSRDEAVSQIFAPSVPDDASVNLAGTTSSASKALAGAVMTGEL